jgi:protease I
METATTKETRLNIRCDKQSHELLDKAASYAHVSVSEGRNAYRTLEQSAEFRQPIAYSDLRSTGYDALLLPGGHAPGMKPYLESALLQSIVADFFARNQPVGAICHGVLLATRARSPAGRSVLYGKRTTALLKRMELAAWTLTCVWLGN